jgi:hypothetical protein
MAQTRPSDEQVAHLIRASITTTLKHGQVTQQLGTHYREFRLIEEAGQFGSQGESYEDVASVRILSWSPFNLSAGYWRLESCVVFAMHLRPGVEHNVGVKMRFKLLKNAAGDPTVEHLAPPSDSSAASVRCGLADHRRYFRGPSRPTRP